MEADVEKTHCCIEGAEARDKKAVITHSEDKRQAAESDSDTRPFFLVSCFRTMQFLTRRCVSSTSNLLFKPTLQAIYEWKAGNLIWSNSESIQESTATTIYELFFWSMV